MDGNIEQSRKLEVIEQLYSEYKKVEKWAVIVGISEYKHQPWNLNYAHRDAEELHKLLLTENGGNFKQENIRLLTNREATKRNIEIALHDFLHKPDKNDLVILYFACHGVPNPKRPNNKLYLLAYDTEPERIAATGLRMREIDDALRDTLIADKVIILADTCHSGGIGGNLGNRSVSDHSEYVNKYLKSLGTAQPGVALLTSAEAREVSREDKKWGGGHGVFTHFVLEGMRGKADTNNDGIVTVGELFEYVRKNVKRSTGDLQHPSIGTNQYDRNLPLAINANFKITSNIPENSKNNNCKRNQKLQSLKEESFCRCRRNWELNGLETEEIDRLTSDKNINILDASSQVVSGKLNIFTGNLGIGKSLIAENFFQNVVDKALQDIHAPIPIFLKAPDLSKSLLEFVKEYCIDIKNTDRTDFILIIDEVDRLTQGMTFLRESALKLVELNPNSMVVLFSRPNKILEPNKNEEYRFNLINIPELSPEKSHYLIQKISQISSVYLKDISDLTESVKDAIKKPFFAILLGVYFKENNFNSFDNIGNLLSYLVETNLDDEEADRLSSQDDF
ncbi:MAG: caspase family protein [Cyanobacteria bacterium P01_G01_bin.39]